MMILEPVKCPHCGYRYRTNIREKVDDGEIDTLVRLGFYNAKRTLGRNTSKSLFIDLTCPNCEKEFEWEVKM